MGWTINRVQGIPKMIQFDFCDNPASAQRAKIQCFSEGCRSCKKFSNPELTQGVTIMLSKRVGHDCSTFTRTP